MKIYVNNEHARYWIDFANLGESTQDLTEWGGQSTQIAFIDSQDGSYEFLKLSLKIADRADLLFLFVMEFTDPVWYQEFDRPNVVLILNGMVNQKIKHAQVINYFSFFHETAAFYRSRPHYVNGLTSDNKKFFFDALLGRRKLHRDDVYHGISHVKNIVTYFVTPNEDDIRDRSNQEFIWPTEILDKPTHPVCFTMQDLDIDGVTLSLSKIIPVDIYNQTHYSLVAETCVDNRWSFFTEKIAKPIIAGRMFLVAGGQYYLKNLRDLGFKTFINVIDESYDNEPDSQTRVEMILSQVKWLETQDPRKILQQIQHITAHNQQHIFNTEWQAPIRNLGLYLKN